jgi:hypothetical protein
MIPADPSSPVLAMVALEGEDGSQWCAPFRSMVPIAATFASLMGSRQCRRT